MSGGYRGGRSIASVLGFVLGSSAASVAADAQVAGTLTVEVTYRSNGTPYPLHGARVRMGTTSNAGAFGTVTTGTNGRAVFGNIVLGIALEVTVIGDTIGTLGVAQGTRLTYVAKSTGLILPVELPVTPLPKALPTPPTAIPALVGTLKTDPGPVAGKYFVDLYTDGTSTRYLSVDGAPTEVFVTLNQLDPPSWAPATVSGYNRLAPVRVQLPPGDAFRTIFVKLRNAAGESPRYTVQVQSVDPNPCQFQMKRGWGATPVVTETIVLAKGQSRGFAGEGKDARYFNNWGPHPLTLTIDADSTHNTSGATMQVVLKRHEVRFEQWPTQLYVAKCN